ncbi:MAG: FxLYD domain-containing protein [Verrucomicrobiota bacterium]
MLKIKNLRGECQHCGGPIEFHAEHTGTTAECPHCGQQTELMLALPQESPSPVPKKAIVFTVVAILILGGGLVAANIALKRAKRIQTQRLPVPQAEPEKPAASANPFAAQGFGVSAVTLEAGTGSSLVYAVGLVTNVTVRQRFGLKVELELFAADGSQVGKATDYQKVLEPSGTWQFRALAVDKRAKTAQIVGLKEAQ